MALAGLIAFELFQIGDLLPPHILKAYQIAGLGTVIPLGGAEIIKGIKSDDLAWVHLDANHAETKSWLERELSFLDPFIISALLEDETRPRATQIGQGALIILRGINLTEGAEAEDMISIRLYVDDARIISLERRPLRAVQDIEKSLGAKQDIKESGEFITRLSRLLTQRIETIISRLDDETDELEQDILRDSDVSIRKKIVELRQKAIVLRRHMAPQREALSQLRQMDMPWLKDVHQRALFESYNQTTRLVEELDSVRERAQIIKDEFASILSDRLNKNTYVLSVIAAIFLPLGFLTGLFGINIGGMPGVENGSAFWVFSIALTIIVMLQVWIFKRLKWF